MHVIAVVDVHAEVLLLKQLHHLEFLAKVGLACRANAEVNRAQLAHDLVSGLLSNDLISHLTAFESKTTRSWDVLL